MWRGRAASVRGRGIVPGRSTRSLDLAQAMSWRSRFHHLKHPKRRPRMKEPRALDLVSRWPRLSKIFLNLAIRKLGTEEFLATGPTRARFRTKRLKAVALFRQRFGDPPWLKDYAGRRSPG